MLRNKRINRRVKDTEDINELEEKELENNQAEDAATESGAIKDGAAKDSQAKEGRSKDKKQRGAKNPKTPKVNSKLAQRTFLPEEIISFEEIDTANEDFSADRANTVAKNAMSACGVRQAAIVPEKVALNALNFDIDLNQGERCDQKRSGRCWMFAALNCFRQQVIANYKLENFEFSQSYPLFFDKLEKCNWFFEQVIATLDKPLHSREVDFLLTDPLCDGGQWDMFAALVEKYGLVPKDAYPETANSENTDQLCAYLTRYLRKCAYELRQAYVQTQDKQILREIKKSYMLFCQRMLIMAFGMPPKNFDVILRSKDDKVVLSGNFDPQSFAKKVLRTQVKDYVSLISAPTKDKPFMQSYSVEMLGNVVEAGGVRHLNLPIERLKECAIAQLKDGQPVWFGCDVDQSYLASKGIMDIAAIDVDSLFGFDVEHGFSRELRLDYGESFMTHAMVFEGVRFDKKKNPLLWKVENSWGKDHGRDGFDSMSDEWFSEYVYQVVVNKKYLSSAERKAYDKVPIQLKPWDPFGALA